jgi:hypothetical protein
MPPSRSGLRKCGMFLVGLDLLGFAGLIAGGIAFVRNRRDQRSHPQDSRALLMFVLVGILLSVASPFVEYPFGDSDRVVGFPFVAAVFERHGKHWDDFVGPLTLPAYIANATFWLLLPQLVLRVARSRKGQRRSA